MDSTIVRVIKYLPQYLADIVCLLFGTTNFISSKNTYKSVTVEESIFFMGFSLGIADLLFLPLLPQVFRFGNYLAAGSVFFVLMLFIYMATLQAAWFFVKNKMPLRRFIVIYSYYYGIINIFGISLLIICLMVFKVVEPELYGGFINALFIHSPLPNLLDNSVFEFALYLFACGSIFIFFWANTAWRSFYKMTGLYQKHTYFMPFVMIFIGIPTALYLCIFKFLSLL